MSVMESILCARTGIACEDQYNIEQVKGIGAYSSLYFWIDWPLPEFFARMRQVLAAALV